MCAVASENVQICSDRVYSGVKKCAQTARLALTLCKMPSHFFDAKNSLNGPPVKRFRPQRCQNFRYQNSHHPIHASASRRNELRSLRKGCHASDHRARRHSQGQRGSRRRPRRRRKPALAGGSQRRHHGRRVHRQGHERLTFSAASLPGRGATGAPRQPPDSRPAHPECPHMSRSLRCEPSAPCATLRRVEYAMTPRNEYPRDAMRSTHTSSGRGESPHRRYVTPHAARAACVTSPRAPAIVAFATPAGSADLVRSQSRRS